MVAEGDPERRPPVLEPRWLQVRLTHRLDHGVDPTAAVLDKVQVLQRLHEGSVAGGLGILDVLLGDVPEQPAGTVDLQSVGEEPDLYLTATDVAAVVPVS